MITFLCHRYLAKHYFCLKVFLVDISWHNIILESMEGESDEGGQLMQSFLYDVPPCPPSSLFGYLQCVPMFSLTNHKNAKECYLKMTDPLLHMIGLQLCKDSFSLRLSHFNYFSNYSIGMDYNGE